MKFQLAFPWRLRMWHTFLKMFSALLWFFVWKCVFSSLIDLLIRRGVCVCVLCSVVLYTDFSPCLRQSWQRFLKLCGSLSLSLHFPVLLTVQKLINFM